MIFSGRFRQPSFFIGSGTVICVYQGAQPTMDEYITDYDTFYNFTSSNILKLIIKANANPTILQVSENQSRHTTQGIKSFNSGVATWASIHSIMANSSSYVSSDFSPEGYYFLSDTEFSSLQQSILDNVNDATDIATAYLSRVITIVPVSDLSDNGVIKFRSTSFVHPSIDDTDRAIDMSIIGVPITAGSGLDDLYGG